MGSHALIASNTITDNEVFNPLERRRRALPRMGGRRPLGTRSTNRAPEGAAVYATVSRPMLFNNYIAQNEHYYLPTAYFGSVNGAVDLDISAGQLDVDFNYFVSNVATSAMYVNAPYRGTIANNLFVGNYAWDRQQSTGGEGGAIWLMTRTNPPETLQIVGNTFAGNDATNVWSGEMGGAIAVLPVSSSAVIGNNVMAFNTSGIYQRPGFATSPVLVRNDMWNGASNYVGIPAGPTDLVADPLFVNRSGGNYRLQLSRP